MEQVDRDRIDQQGKKLFEAYLKENKIVYDKIDELVQRKEVFLMNYRLIKKHNYKTGNNGYATMKLNQFSDWYEIEYHNLLKLIVNQLKKI